MPSASRTMKSKTGKLPLNEKAYRRIKEMIVSVKLPPGNRIEESALARQLNIGRTPMREALFRLVAEGLVAMVRGRGFFVRDISMHDLRSLFETMLVLERSAVLLAARRIRPDQIKKMTRFNRELSLAWKAGDYLGVTRKNSRFHAVVYQATDNPFLVSYLNNLQSQTQRLAYLCFSKDTGSYDMLSHAELAVRDHQNLIAFLQSRKTGEAIAVITRHVELFHRRVQSCVLPLSENLEAILPFQAA